MTYGLYNDLVKEVLNFSKTFKVNLSPQIKSTTLITELRKAEFLAYDEVFGEDEYTWKDIRELEMSEVWADYYEKPDDEKPKNLDDLLEVISENIRECDYPYNTFFNDIVGDLKNCAVNRSINGLKDSFFEEIFKIYQSGGFPCGWDGNYPESGNIIVYYAE